MPTKTEVLSEIIRIYDENSYLKRELQVLQDKNQMSGLQKYLYMLGHKSIVDKLVTGWYFRDAAPKVATRLSEDAEWTVVPFQVWFNSISSDMFYTKDLVEVLSSGVISFEGLKLELEEDLRDFYNQLVTEFYEGHNEVVRRD